MDASIFVSEILLSDSHASDATQAFVHIPATDPGGL